MKFILYSLNYSPELTGIGKYNGEMCSELILRGVNVSAVVAPPYYPEWVVHKGYSSVSYNNSTVNGVSVTRCPLFVPQKVTTLKRIIHLASFAFSSGVALLSKLLSKPDVLFLVQPTLFCAPVALLYCKFTGTKAVMHIQDYEVDALFGLGMMSTGKAVNFAKTTEKWLMSKFDAISTISYSMIDNAKSKGVTDDKIIYFPNWSDTDFVTPKSDGSTLKKEWGFNESDKVILYAGNIGNKQGLEIVLAAAKHYQENPNIKFVLVGAGSHAKVLKAQTEQMQLENVYFKPLLAWERVPEMLALADIHLVIQKKGAADAVLPSKLTNILSAGGHALVTAEAHTELGKIEQNHSGIYSCVEPENIQAFIEGIDQLLLKDLSIYNKVARSFAEEYLAKDKILNKFVEDLNSLVNQQITRIV